MREARAGGIGKSIPFRIHANEVVMPGSAREWIVDRFALQAIYDGVLNRRVPRPPWYATDGGVLLTLLGMQVLTGLVLALTYSPAAETAYESVVEITESQTLGWLVRGLHYWSGGLMVVVLFYHLYRQLLMGGYKSPREGTWMIGVLLFFCVLLMSYTGYLLRWDERAVHGVRVMLHMLVRVPLLGESLALVVQGGTDIGPRTLTRLYIVHVLLTPLLMFLLVGAHMYLIIQRGTITRAERAKPPASAEDQKRMYHEEAESPRGEYFFPGTMFKELVVSAVAVGLAFVLTVTLGARELMPEGNLTQVSTPAEEWWFWWYSGLIALLPPSIAPWFVVVFPVAVFCILMAIPFVDRRPHRGVLKRPVWLVIVLAIVVAQLMLSDYRRRSSFTGWPDEEPPQVPASVTLSPDAEQGRLLFAQYGCNSCHPVAGEVGVATDFAKITEPLSLEAIRAYVLEPPPEVAMPSYKGRLQGRELDYVVEFCHVAQTFPRRE
jgi:ubiquinol-cytochrome c reductase cytochrome b subunit